MMKLKKKILWFLTKRNNLIFIINLIFLMSWLTCSCSLSRAPRDHDDDDRLKPHLCGREYLGIPPPTKGSFIKRLCKRKLSLLSQSKLFMNIHYPCWIFDEKLCLFHWVSFQLFDHCDLCRVGV